MEHPHGGSGLPLDVSALPLVLRLVLLVTAALVAGVGIARPKLLAVPAGVTVFAAAAAAVSAGVAVVEGVVSGVHVVGTLAHVLLVALVPLLLRFKAVVWPAGALAVLVVIETAGGRSDVGYAADTMYVALVVAWFALATLAVGAPVDAVRWGWLRPASLAVTLAVALVGIGLVRLLGSGVAFDRRLYQTVLGLVLLGIVVAALLVAVAALLGPVKAFRFGTVGVVAAFAGWAAQAAVAVPGDLPVPGVPVLAGTSVSGVDVPVLISPHRTGRNLVHLPASAGNQVRVSVGDGPGTTATPRAGADGTWAEVDLPPGRGTVTLTIGDDSGSVGVDPASGPKSELDGDSPECAISALGSIVAGRQPASTCPSESLSGEDEKALRGLVVFLQKRGAAGVVLDADQSGRSTKAAEVVRASAAEVGLRLDTEPRGDNALLTVSGWEGAYKALSAAGAHQAEDAVYPFGLFVAPWLVNAPQVTAVTTVAAALDFDPRHQTAVSYAIAVGAAFGGETPTVTGLRAWLGDQQGLRHEPQVYAAAQVNAMPMGAGEPHVPGMPMPERLLGQWVPKTTVVPVSGPLTEFTRKEGETK